MNNCDRIVNAFFFLFFWIVTVFVLSQLHLLDKVNQDILIIVHLAAFFFSLTTSPVTWIIKALGLEIGSNTPDHFQVDKTIENEKTNVIVRDYSKPCDSRAINEVLSKQTK